ncbi:OLC1v1011641C1 [Oldenlandia corymbosa var. corymbosa]|uniref:OLC1v1011641C1 n=1 Tax=Oldenlandia corymbosa var. corymbosa TaxID=529605 RepID=A0AAV1DU31_OLDCO|nr:OLC1v1011641C1 [Oldenlandia corymbosa var. corymbosa]
MAKKKLNNPPKEETPAMDEITEKMESLKSLNAMLLKETVERRQQVDSLLESKASLESQVTRSNSENEALKSELGRLSEGFFSVEVERNVMVVFVSHQSELIEKERVQVEIQMKGLEGKMEEILKGRDELEKLKIQREREIESLNEKVKQLGLEIAKERDFSNGLCSQRDQMKDKLEVQIRETNDLGIRLIETEKKERLVQEEVENLRVRCSLVEKEKLESAKKIESLRRDKESLEMSLRETNDVVKHLRQEIVGIGKEKEGLEEEKKLQMTKSKELEKAVAGLEEMVGSLRKEEEEFRQVVAELEKKCVDSEESEREMRRQIDEMVKEKDEKERKLLKVVEGKRSVEKELDDALKQLNELKLKLNELINEKSELSESKERKENELVESEKQVAELSKAVLGLEDSCRVQKGEILALESEVRSYKDSHERASIERDQAMKGMEEQKQNVVSLLEKIEVMEKNLEKNLKTIEELRTESAKVSEEKDNLEGQHTLLEQELASAKNEIVAARNELHAVKLKGETAALNWDQVLKVLTSTTMLVCTKDDLSATTGAGVEINGDLEPYAKLEAIKNAFKRKEKTLEDMKRQLVHLHKSVEEAQHKKGFWTTVSSLTTICAAISLSLAYVARGGH